jgi:hypothetical protein
MQETRSRAQRLEAIKRATANALVTVAVGRGRLAAARTVRAHVQARLSLTELEQRAAFILHMGNYAAGIELSTTPQPAPHSNEVA